MCVFFFVYSVMTIYNHRIILFQGLYDIMSLTGTKQNGTTSRKKTNVSPSELRCLYMLSELDCKSSKMLKTHHVISATSDRSVKTMTTKDAVE